MEETSPSTYPSEIDCHTDAKPDTPRQEQAVIVQDLRVTEELGH